MKQGREDTERDSKLQKYCQLHRLAQTESWNWSQFSYIIRTKIVHTKRTHKELLVALGGESAELKKGGRAALARATRRKRKMLGAKKEEKVLNTQGQIKLLTLAAIIFGCDTLNHTVSGQQIRMKDDTGWHTGCCIGANPVSHHISRQKQAWYWTHNCSRPLLSGISLFLDLKNIYRTVLKRAIPAFWIS